LQKVPCGFSEELENLLMLAQRWHMVLHALFPCMLFSLLAMQSNLVNLKKNPKP